MKNWKLHFELNKQAKEIEFIIEKLTDYLISFKNKESEEYNFYKGHLKFYQNKHLNLINHIASNR